ncbi:MAG: hypothetical protein AAF432_08560 [Planctomycetota bacterium]
MSHRSEIAAQRPPGPSARFPDVLACHCDCGRLSVHLPGLPWLSDSQGGGVPVIVGQKKSNTSGRATGILPDVGVARLIT